MKTRAVSAAPVGLASVLDAIFTADRECPCRQGGHHDRALPNEVTGTMSQPLKLVGGAAALITAALVGGTLIGSVLAAPLGSDSSDPTPVLGGDETTEGDATAYCQVFLDTFASELGVGTDELVPAAKAATIAAINAAVEAGDLTQDVADRMIARVEAWDGEGCRWIGFKLGHWAHHAARVDFLSGMWEAAAGSLGMTTAELREALADSTLEEVAEAEGVPYADVVAAALASAQADLDAAVEAGTIAQEKADAILERLEAALNDGDIGDWGLRREWFHRDPNAPSQSPSGDEADSAANAA